MGSITPTSPAFSATPETVAFDGLLFDMDGTIIDSTAAVVKHWERFTCLVLHSGVALANSPVLTTASARK